MPRKRKTTNIHRGENPKDNYTVLSNDLLQNKELSNAARGLLVLLLSRPADWEINTRELANGKDGKKAILTSLRELEKAGYYTCKKYPDPFDGGKWRWEKKVYSEPVPEEKRTWKPTKRDLAVQEKARLAELEAQELGTPPPEDSPF